MKLGRENNYKRNKNVHNKLVLRVSPASSCPVEGREETLGTGLLLQWWI